MSVFSVALFLIVGHTGLKQSDQFISVFWNFFDLVSLIFHFPEKPDDTGRGIQPDPVSDSAVTIRVVGEDDGHPFISIRRFSQADPVGCVAGPRHLQDCAKSALDRP